MKNNKKRGQTRPPFLQIYSPTLECYHFEKNFVKAEGEIKVESRKSKVESRITVLQGRR